jgi:hypothetical protein
MTNANSNQLMFLHKSTWSPRYDSTFFSVTMETKEWIRTERPTQPPVISGKTNLPAFYYVITIHREHSKVSIKRRYSDFKWLYEQLKGCPPHDGDPSTTIRLPPGSCLWQAQTEEFSQNRLLQLRDFLNDVLSRPGYANHPAVRLFLELEQ